MRDSFDRRSFLRATGGLAAGMGGLGSINTAAAAAETIDIASPAGVETTIQKYDEYYDDGWEHRVGALPEDIEAFDSGRLRLADYHTFLWDADWKIMNNVRDDAESASVSKTEGVPEVSITSELEFLGQNKFTIQDSYKATLTQDVLLTKDRPAMMVDTDVEYAPTIGDTVPSNRHTAYHLLNPEIDDYDSGGAGDEAWLDRYNGYDVLVMKDGQWHAVFAREHDRPQVGRGYEQLDTEFEGARVGIEGTTSGGDESAWHDIDTEADGWLDSNEYNSGDVDAAVGTYLFDDSFHQWSTAIGFGYSYEEAAGNATAVLDNGYATELYRYK